MERSLCLRTQGAALALASILLVDCSLDDRTLLASGAVGGSAGLLSSGTGGQTHSAIGGQTDGANSGGTGAVGSTGAEAGLDSSSRGTGGDPGAAGSVGAGGDTSSGGSGAAGNAGDGGSAGSGGGGGDASSGTCGDLDDNGIQDCAETLLRNFGFHTDASAWVAEPRAEQRWDPTDARSGIASGALSVVNVNRIDTREIGYTMVGSGQCLDVAPLRTYVLGALLRIPRDQGEGHAGMNVFLYADPGCTGTFLHAYTPILVSEADTWRATRGEFETSAGTRSVHVRLVTSKPFAQSSFGALFDSLLLRSE